MNVKTMAETPSEGEISFNEDVEEDNTSTDSPAENNDTDDTQSADGDDEENNQQDNEDGDDNKVTNKTPFHEHPRWKEREEEWDKRFNEQESRHQEDMRKFREEFSSNKKPAESKPIPSWFGGDQEQWDAFQADRQKEIDDAVKQAQEGALEKINSSKTSEQKAIDEATAYMKSEISAIEGDSTLNPSGKKVDPNKLLKTVMDNELIDSKGRWNYRAGIKILNATENKETHKLNTDNKKKIAGATTSESKGESQPSAFKTTKDFTINRPW